ncbi:MAG: hypothetical protein A3C56_10655 [Ignavibacteria bacterium RIFCSPHIGHO2_02_FULL_56_12]|nr:MAG: hypothetical protein A3C56_10655 [Ignavibacteria bacterium RIFCSPHIGHO2_02_FULL_56_12]
MSIVIARIIGIDYGERRIGIALSDPLGITAQPWGVVDNSPQGMGALKDLVMREGVKTAVVGMPLNLRGEKGRKAEEVEAFIGRLRDVTGLEVLTWDERFTTSIAQQTYRDMGAKRKDRSTRDGRIDAMAAALILQGFLDSAKHSRAC